MVENEPGWNPADCSQSNAAGSNSGQDVHQREGTHHVVPLPLLPVLVVLLVVRDDALGPPVHQLGHEVAGVLPGQPWHMTASLLLHRAPVV